jgi:transcriptional regulator
MFKHNRYQEKDNGKLLAFMQAYPFALITGFGADGYPVATQVPVEVEQTADGHILITGHFARKTDHAEAFGANPHALVVFNGPHAYISASWYTDTRMASTWNYMTVHAKGQLQFMDGEGTLALIKKLTDRYEADSAEPAAMEKMDEAYIRNNLKAIVGFSIRVEQLDAVFKLSQNRDAVSHQSIIDHLRLRGGDDALAIAAAMEGWYRGG